LISAGALPQTQLGNLQCSPDPQAGFKGGYFYPIGGKGEEEKGRRGREG